MTRKTFLKSATLFTAVMIAVVFVVSGSAWAVLPGSTAVIAQPGIGAQVIAQPQASAFAPEGFIAQPIVRPIFNPFFRPVFNPFFRPFFNPFLFNVDADPFFFNQPFFEAD
jgi:hypothetical protein